LFPLGDNLPNFILGAQANGTSKPSFTSVSLENEGGRKREDLEVAVADAAGQIYAGAN